MSCYYWSRIFFENCKIYLYECSICVYLPYIVYRYKMWLSYSGFFFVKLHFFAFFLHFFCIFFCIFLYIFFSFKSIKTGFWLLSIFKNLSKCDTLNDTPIAPTWHTLYQNISLILRMNVHCNKFLRIYIKQIIWILHWIIHYIFQVVANIDFIWFVTLKCSA